MRPLLVAVGVIVAALGLMWALQGAFVLPATFMRGPAWVGIGAAVAVGGLAIAVLGIRVAGPSKKRDVA